jgi:Flagellar hook-length control protein FliK
MTSLPPGLPAGPATAAPGALPGLAGLLAPLLAPPLASAPGSPVPPSFALIQLPDPVRTPPVPTLLAIPAPDTGAVLVVEQLALPTAPPVPAARLTEPPSTASVDPLAEPPEAGEGAPEGAAPEAAYVPAWALLLVPELANLALPAAPEPPAAPPWPPLVAEPAGRSPLQRSAGPARDWQATLPAVAVPAALPLPRPSVPDLPLPAPVAAPPVPPAAIPPSAARPEQPASRIVPPLALAHPAGDRPARLEAIRPPIVVPVPVPPAADLPAPAPAPASALAAATAALVPAPAAVQPALPPAAEAVPLPIAAVPLPAEPPAPRRRADPQAVAAEPAGPAAVLQPGLAAPIAPAASPPPAQTPAQLPAAAPTADPPADAGLEIASDRLGQVSVRLEGGPDQLQVALQAQPAAAALIGAEGPRLQQDLAAAGVALAGLSINGQRADLSGGGRRGNRPPRSEGDPLVAARRISAPQSSTAQSIDRFA